MVYKYFNGPNQALNLQQITNQDSQSQSSCPNPIAVDGYFLILRLVIAVAVLAFLEAYLFVCSVDTGPIGE